MGPTDDIRGLGVTRDRMRPVTQSVPPNPLDGQMLDLEEVRARLINGQDAFVPGFGIFKPRGRSVTFSADKDLKKLLKPAAPQARPDGPIGEQRQAPDGQSRTPPF